MSGRRLPKWCTEFRDRHGKIRVRFRRKGFVDYYFKAPAWSAEFMAEYQACLAGKAAERVQPGSGRTKPGTVDALVIAYYASPEFLSTYRNQIDRFREEHGSKRVALIERQHIKAILGKRASTPSAANNLLDRLKTLMRFAVEIGMRKTDPTVGMRQAFKVDSDGFHTWTEAELAAFNERHRKGSRAHLALALLLYTGQRRSDVVRMGWQHVSEGRISVRQQKTGARLELRIHPNLAAILAETPRDNLTFLVTSQGAPYSPAGFGNWFREQCDAAGLPQCSAHGLRKAAARRLAEAGCSNQQIKAITGHKTDAEVSRYTAAADQARLGDQAIAAISGTHDERKTSNPSDKVSQNES